MDLYGRDRERNGEIVSRYGNVDVATLRRAYGEGFGIFIPPCARLSEALTMLDKRSLAVLLTDYEAGAFRRKIDRHTAIVAAPSGTHRSS